MGREARGCQRSEGARRIYGLQGGEWPAEQVRSIPLPAYRAALDAQFRQLIAGEAPMTSSLRSGGRATNGCCRCIRRRSTTGDGQGVRHRPGRSERLRSEAALRESEQLLQETQSIARIGGYVYDIPAGTWRGSKVLYEIFGLEGLRARTVEEWAGVIHPDWRGRMVAYLQNEVIGRHTRFDKEYMIVRARDAAERWVHGLASLSSMPGAAHSMLGTIRDITDQRHTEAMLRQTEEDFRQAQKMEAVGQLAGASRTTSTTSWPRF